MPTLLPQPDPAAFAERLREAMKNAGQGGRGAGAALARRHQVKPPTASAWLAGRHMPEPSKVRQMSIDYDVDYDWLYFGIGPSEEQGTTVREAPPTPYCAEHTMTSMESQLMEDFRRCDAACRLSIATLASAAARRPR